MNIPMFVGQSLCKSDRVTVPTHFSEPLHKKYYAYQPRVAKSKMKSAPHA